MGLCSIGYAYEPSTFTGNYQWNSVAVSPSATSVTLTYDGSFWFQSNVDVYAYVAPTTNITTPSKTLATAGSIFVPANASIEFSPDYGLRKNYVISFIASSVSGNVSFLNREYIR